jgi:hypothetical protein
MKNFSSIKYFFLACCLFSCNLIQAQQENNWTKDQLMEPSTLVKTLKGNKNIPVILSVGPAAIIPHSIDIGMVSETENKIKLDKELSKLPKDADIVIYCGCCPFEHCPNIRPAIEELKKMKFTNFHLLNLSTSIKADWISKGYPIVD